MPGIKTQIAFFAVGSGLIASGLAMPNSGLPIVFGGGAVAAAGYAVSIMDWKGISPKIPFGKFKKSTGQISPPSVKSPATPNISTQGPPGTVAGPSSGVPTSAPAPGSSSYGPLPSAPETPSTPQKPSGKIPSVHLPKTISDHKIPLSLMGAGLALVVSAIYFLLPSSPQYAVFTGLFIPGVVLLGLGILRLYARPPGVRRFCMHCGYQVLSTQDACGRCHKQPMSGIDTRICPNCNVVNPALAKFCKEYGAEQPAGI